MYMVMVMAKDLAYTNISVREWHRNKWLQKQQQNIK